VRYAACSPREVRSHEKPTAGVWERLQVYLAWSGMSDCKREFCFRAACQEAGRTSLRPLRRMIATRSSASEPIGVHALFWRSPALRYRWRTRLRVSLSSANLSTGTLPATSSRAAVGVPSGASSAASTPTSSHYFRLPRRWPGFCSSAEVPHSVARAVFFPRFTPILVSGGITGLIPRGFLERTRFVAPARPAEPVCFGLRVSRRETCSDDRTIFSGLSTPSAQTTPLGPPRRGPPRNLQKSIVSNVLAPLA